MDTNEGSRVHSGEGQDEKATPCGTAGAQQEQMGKSDLRGWTEDVRSLKNTRENQARLYLTLLLGFGLLRKLHPPLFLLYVYILQLLDKTLQHSVSILEMT